MPRIKDRIKEVTWEKIQQACISCALVYSDCGNSLPVGSLGTGRVVARGCVEV